ncbi:MAG: L,D-transpeptidase family protein [Lachnospiraceae bacterium]|nr:L,D-transpeptidase family protein [Lachnospiraceae bacterium]
MEEIKLNELNEQPAADMPEAVPAGPAPSDEVDRLRAALAEDQTTEMPVIPTDETPAPSDTVSAEDAVPEVAAASDVAPTADEAAVAPEAVIADDTASEPATETEAVPTADEAPADAEAMPTEDETLSAATQLLPDLGAAMPISDEPAEAVVTGDTRPVEPVADSAGPTQPIGPIDDEDETPDLVTEVSVEDLEKKITASTVVTAPRHMPEPDDEDDDDDDEDDEPVKRRSPMKITIVLLLLIVAVFAGVYLFMSYYFMEHFYSGTTINGVDVSGMTVDEVKGSVVSQVKSYTLTIAERDGVEEVLTADQLAWDYVDDHRIDEIMADQNAWEWFTSLAKNKSFKISFATAYDREKAKEAIRSLQCLDESKMIKPQDAVLEKDNTGARIIPEVEGTTIDKDMVTDLVFEALDNAVTRIDLTDPDCYVHPTIKADDENLVKRMNEWNAMVNIELSYTFGDKVEKVSKEDIVAHLKDDGEKVSVDAEWVKSIVKEWANKYDTFGRERQFTTHSGAVVTLPGATYNTGEKDPDTGQELEHASDYGWLLNVDATAEDFISAVENGQSGNREPIFRYKCLGWDNNGLTGNYVEVSIAEQHMWVYKDGQVVVDTDVVTGKDTPTRRTYPGCFAVDAKQSPATLGTIATQGYSSKVTYWLPFDGGRGLHDAPWRDAFGPGIYEANGSHGCVNTPPEAMAKVYEYVEIGMAVCVY